MYYNNIILVITNRILKCRLKNALYNFKIIRMLVVTGILQYHLLLFDVFCFLLRLSF